MYAEQQLPVEEKNEGTAWKACQAALRSPPPPPRWCCAVRQRTPTDTGALLPPPTPPGAPVRAARAAVRPSTPATRRDEPAPARASPRAGPSPAAGCSGRTSRAEPASPHPHPSGGHPPHLSQPPPAPRRPRQRRVRPYRRAGSSSPAPPWRRSPAAAGPRSAPAAPGPGGSRPPRAGSLHPLRASRRGTGARSCHVYLHKKEETPRLPEIAAAGLSSMQRGVGLACPRVSWWSVVSVSPPPPAHTHGPAVQNAAGRGIHGRCCRGRRAAGGGLLDGPKSRRRPGSPATLRTKQEALPTPRGKKKEIMKKN